MRVKRLRRSPSGTVTLSHTHWRIRSTVQGWNKVLWCSATLVKLEVLCSSKSSRQSSSSFEHLMENDSTVRFAGAEMRQRLATFIEFQLISKSHGSPWKQALANATDELCICIDMVYMYYICMCVSVCLCLFQLVARTSIPMPGKCCNGSSMANAPRGQVLIKSKISHWRHRLKPFASRVAMVFSIHLRYLMCYYVLQRWSRAQGATFTTFMQHTSTLKQVDRSFRPLFGATYGKLYGYPVGKGSWWHSSNW